eukprot:gene13023-15385_t
MVAISEITDEVVVTLDGKGRLVAPDKPFAGTIPSDIKKRDTIPRDIKKRDKVPTVDRASPAPKQFEVIHGTVVAKNFDAVDDDIKAQVERELGNEAFRDQVRLATVDTIAEVRDDKSKDYDTATVHYSTALEALNKQGDDASQKLKVQLLTNRAQALLKCEEFGLAKEDCAAALQIDSDHLKALYRGGLACFKLEEYAQGAQWLQSASLLAPSDPDVAALLRRSRQQLAQAGSQEDLLREANAARDEHGLAARCGPAGCVTSPSTLLIVEELVRLLIDEDEEEELVDVPNVLRQLSRVLREEEKNRRFFALCDGPLAVSLFLDDDHVADAKAALQAAGTSPDGAIDWPLDLVLRLADIGVATQLRSFGREQAETCFSRVLHSELNEWRDRALTASYVRVTWQVAVAACELLEYGSRDVGMRTGAYCDTDLSGQSSVLSQVGLLFGSRSYTEFLPVAAASAVATALGNYGQDASSRAALAQAPELAPLTALVRLYNEADNLPGALIDTDGVPNDYSEVRCAEEAVRFVNTKKLQIYNRSAVQVQQSCLRALAQLMRDPVLVKACPSDLIPDLLRIVDQLRGASPMKTAAVLGLDLKPKLYAARPYAADYKNNPMGDMLVNSCSFTVEKGEAGELITPASGQGSEGLQPMPQGLSLIECALEAVLAAAHNRSTARILHHCGALAVLHRLHDYLQTSPGVLARLQRVYVRLALHCPSAATELLSSNSAIPLNALLRSGEDRLMLQAAERLLLLIATCSGDEFVLLTSPKGGLVAVYDKLCELDADAAARREPHGDALHRACQQVFAQCLERSRSAAYGKKSRAGGRLPPGGWWESMDQAELLQREQRITGVPPAAAHAASPRSPTASAPRSRVTQPTTGRDVATPPGASQASEPVAGKAQDQAASAAAAGVECSGSGPAPAEGAQRRQKPLPWDPQPAAGQRGGAEVPESGTGGRAGEEAHLIKKGFLGGPKRRSRRQREDTGVQETGDDVVEEVDMYEDPSPPPAALPSEQHDPAATLTERDGLDFSNLDNLDWDWFWSLQLMHDGVSGDLEIGGCDGGTPKAQKAAEQQALARAAARQAEEARLREQEKELYTAGAPEEDYDPDFEEDFQKWKESCAAELQRKAKAALKEVSQSSKGVQEEKEYDEDGLRTKWDSAPSRNVRDLRRVWLNTDLKDKIRWTQSSSEVTVCVKVPPATRSKDLQ